MITWWLAQHVVTTGLLVAAVAGVCRLLRSRPAVAHALWVVVLIKFMTPPVLFWPWHIQWPVPASTVSERPELPLTTPSDVFEGSTPTAALSAPVWVEEAIAPSPSFDYEEFAPPAESPAVAADQCRPVSPKPAAGFGETRLLSIGQSSIRAENVLPRAALAVWLCGAAVMIAVQGRRIVRHRRLVRSAAPAPPRLVRDVERMAALLRVRPIETLVTRQLTSPCVSCVGRLRLLWPERLIGEAEVSRYRGVLAHELAHVRRRDHWIAWLELAASVVWWFNPLFWLVRRHLRETAEMACDALALSVLPNSRFSYAEVFFELSSGMQAPSPVPALGAISGSAKSFERRFSMILSEHVSGRLSRWGFTAVCLAAAIALPAWSLGQSAVDESKPATAAAPPAPAASADPTALPPAIDPGAAPMQPSGSITAIDPETGLVKISLGEDKTIRKDESLDVYRLDPSPKYLGKLQILQTSETEAVGRPASPVKTLRIGDRVSHIRSVAQAPLPPPQAVQPPPSDDKSSLEARLQKIEATLDLILKRLDGAAAKPGPESNKRPTIGLYDATNPLAEGVLAATDTPTRRYLLEQAPRGKPTLIAIDSKMQKSLWQTDLSEAVAKAGSDATTSIKWQIAQPPAGKHIDVRATSPSLTITFSVDAETGRIAQVSVTHPAAPQTASTLLPRPVPLPAVPLSRPAAANPAAIPSTPLAGGGAPNTILSAPVAVPPSHETSPPASAMSQIDPVNLATAYIDAQGNLKLARSRYERLKSLATAAVVSTEELDAAEINLETAQQKAKVLTAVAQAARDAAQAELEHVERMLKKGFASESSAAAARAKVRLLESILQQSPATPATEPRTTPPRR